MPGQVTLEFFPTGIKTKVQKGTNLFDAAQNHGILLRSDCGGNGTCGKCRVIIDNPGNLTPKTRIEEKMHASFPLTSSQRLACQSKISGPLTVTIPDDLIVKKENSGKTDIKGSFPVNPDIKRGKKIRLGFAFDIGTTTIAAYLCNLNYGKIITSKAMVNPQKQFGEDVISRIAAIGLDMANLKKLHHLVTDGINDLIRLCLESTGNKKSDIEEVTVVGNTTMEHILAGLNPQSIGISPYLPVTRSSILTCAIDVGLDLLPTTPIYIFPVISGFLGGDILSALLADRSYKRKGTTLIIDIGTNGELILTSSKGMWATSCATGPALEGAQLSCGMRAAAGAISKVFFDPDTDNKILFKTIDNKKPLGICGSGIIDALATMRKAKITRENGTFNTGKSGVGYDEKGTGREFTLPGTDIHITLKDIRQVQLAKAALFVGIESLLHKAEITTIDRVLLTGAFGARFNWQNARDIGMLPHGILKRKVESVQNMAGIGAVIALLDKNKRTEIETVAQKINFIDLSCEPNFTLKFSNATRFPTLKKIV